MAALRHVQAEHLGRRVDVEDVVEDGPGAAVVIGLVSGTFPGSPIRLRYTFRLSEGTITHLEIK